MWIGIEHPQSMYFSNLAKISNYVSVAAKPKKDDNNKKLHYNQLEKVNVGSGELRDLF
jgi:hypothetical protein